MGARKISSRHLQKSVDSIGLRRKANKHAKALLAYIREDAQRYFKKMPSLRSVFYLVDGRKTGKWVDVVRPDRNMTLREVKKTYPNVHLLLQMVRKRVKAHHRKAGEVISAHCQLEGMSKKALSLAARLDRLLGS